MLSGEQVVDNGVEAGSNRGDGFGLRDQMPGLGSKFSAGAFSSTTGIVSSSVIINFLRGLRGK
jgi:hypothetical protein